MRIIFMGNPEFAIPTLKSLINSNHNIVGVVSNPPKPMGRGRKLSSTAVGSFAIDHKLNLIEPESLRSPELNKNLSELEPDIFVVVAYKILPKTLINIPKFGAINLHASLLPKYRGAGPIQWSLMNGDKNTGITVFQIKPQVDTGNILLQKEIKIRDEDNMYSLGMRLCELGADLILKALDGIEGGQIKGKPQDPNLASPAPKITKDLTRINWYWSALKIHNWIRGLSPYPGMYSSINNKKFRIFKTCIEKNTDNIPGEVIQVDESMMKVSTGDGSLSLIDVQIEGKRKMSVAEFLRGADIKVGDQLGL